jgi:hypothetical protein
MAQGRCKAMPLRSKLFTDESTERNRAAHQKLERCLVNDVDHVMQGAKGPHVSKIQAALFLVLPDLTLPDNELSDPATREGFYGPATAAAVLRYKTNHKPPIINKAYQNAPDRIVGKMTIKFLDDDLAAKDPGPAPPVPPPTPLTMSALASRDKATSIQWVNAAITKLTEAKAFLANPPPGPLRGFPPIMPPTVAATMSALEVHFRVSTATISLAAYIDQVIEIYRKDVGVLNGSSGVFVDDTTSAEAVKGTPAHVPFGSGKVNFTPAFKERSGTTGFGTNCRAAMVLHEPVHVVDHPAASNGANHINDVLAKAQYDAQPAMNRLHNAHSYSNFAQHAFFGRDTRFGIGRIAE